MHVLTERSQSKNSIHYMILTLWDSGKGKTIETMER